MVGSVPVEIKVEAFGGHDAKWTKKGKPKGEKARVAFSEGTIPWKGKPLHATVETSMAHAPVVCAIGSMSPPDRSEQLFSNRLVGSHLP